MASLLDVALTIPLSKGQSFNVDTMNKFINQAVVREKALKVIQYLARLTAFELKKRKAAKQWHDHFLQLSKTLSTARRFFKFLRWFRHLLDLRDAMKMQAPIKYLFYLEFGCNMMADISEDITSLGKVKIIPSNWLPSRTEFYANWCQLPLAFVEVAVSLVKLNKVDSEDPIKLKMARLELLKYICDIGKGFYDCELSFAREDVFIWSGLVAGLITTHKQIIKSLKLPDDIQRNPSAHH